MRNIARFLIALAAVNLVAAAVADTVTWTGDGGSDARWTNPANWAGGVLPAFDGSEDVVISVVNAAGTVMDLDGDKWINSLTSSHTSPNFIISNSVLKVATYIRKGNQAQMYVKSGLEIDGSLVVRCDNASYSGIYLDGQITETTVASDLIIESIVGTVFLMNTNNAYSGDTIVRRGILQLDAAAPAIGRGVAGVANNPIIIGDSQTGDNNWSAKIVMPNGVNVGRAVHVVDTGSSVKPEVELAGDAGVRTFSLLLDTDIALRFGQPKNNGTLGGVISGPGGFERIGGTETLILGNVANDFSGDILLSNGSITFDIDGPTNALGKGESAIVVRSLGGTTARGISARGNGVFTRDIELLGGIPNTQRGVNLGVANSGDVLFTGDIAMNTPDLVTFDVPTSSSAEFSGLISGTSAYVRVAGHTGTGNRICLSNPGNTFTGQIEGGPGILFVGADAPRGGPGALGAHPVVNLNVQTGGVNAPGLLSEGSYVIGQDIVVSNTGFTGVIYLGGVAANTHTVYTGDVTLLRTNNVSNNDLRLQSGNNSLVTFSGKVSGPGDWIINSGWPAKFATSGGDIEFTNPHNDFSGIMNITYGHLRIAATGADGDPEGLFEFGSTTTGAKIGVLTSGPATVRRSGSVYPHGNANGECTLGGVTPHESRFAGDYAFDRLQEGARTKNYLYATNDATVHFDGTLAAGAGHTITKRGPGRVNINGPLLVPTFTVTEGTLGGSGAMTNKLTFPSGTTFSPGSPLGTLVVSNTVTLNAGSTFLAQIHKTYAGAAEAWGTVTINPGVTFTAPAKPCHDRILLRYHAALVGAFTATNMPPSAKLSYGTGFDSEIRLTIPSPGTLLLLR